MVFREVPVVRVWRRSGHRRTRYDASKFRNFDRLKRRGHQKVGHVTSRNRRRLRDAPSVENLDRSEQRSIFGEFSKKRPFSQGYACLWAVGKFNNGVEDRTPLHLAYSESSSRSRNDGRCRGNCGGSQDEHVGVRIVSLVLKLDF